MKFIKITPENYNGWIERIDENKTIFLQDVKPGEKFQIEVLEMTQEEFDNLPEFTGP